MAAAGFLAALLGLAGALAFFSPVAAFLAGVFFFFSPSALGALAFLGAAAFLGLASPSALGALGFLAAGFCSRQARGRASYLQIL